jgi:hypothetical protein
MAEPAARPVGECWCGCGERVGVGAFFVPGHDRRAESAVIRREYGGIPQFLARHGYGPGARRTHDASEWTR